MLEKSSQSHPGLVLAGCFVGHDVQPRFVRITATTEEELGPEPPFEASARRRTTALSTRGLVYHPKINAPSG